MYINHLAIILYLPALSSSSSETTDPPSFDLGAVNVKDPHQQTLLKKTPIRNIVFSFHVP